MYPRIRYATQLATFLAAFCLAPFASATTSGTKTQQHVWMQSHYTVIEHDLRTQSLDAVIPHITTLVSIWEQRDGAMSGEVSPLLITAIIHHTDTTLAMMGASTAAYSKWLNELEGIVFTDFSGDQFAALVALKSALSDALKHYVAIEPVQSQHTVALQLLTHIEAITVRTVQ